jgi:N utilization substance protein B
MLNRRILRIKVFQVLYAYQREDNPVTARYETFLLNSIKNTEEIYNFILNLPLEIRFYIENEANPAETKYFPTKRDIETGRTFIYNQVIDKIKDSPQFSEKLKRVKHQWTSNKELLRIIFNDFKGGKFFQKYLDEPEKDFEAQKRLLLSFFADFLPDHSDFDQYMEELDIHWQDDRKMIFNYLHKSIESIEEKGGRNFVFELSDNWDEDWGFARDLFRKTLIHDTEYEGLIMSKTQKWDSDRIAITDMLLMKMALCEMLEFPSIPVKVTINEYLEIAKVYSTPKSNAFLNGILDKIMNELKSENKILKQGRGLVE